MSTPKSAPPQLTNPPEISDAEFEDALALVPSAVLPEPVSIYLAPRYGWDNPDDVLHARQYLGDMKGFITRGEAGLEQARTVLFQLRNFGLSEKTAGRLLMSIMQPPQSPTAIRSQAWEVYRTQSIMPGLQSLAIPPQKPGLKAPDADDDLDDPHAFEGGGPPVWPKPLLYDPKQNEAKLAELFTYERPANLIVSDGVIYTLGSDHMWREIPHEELRAEIRATDPMKTLNTPRLDAIIKEIHADKFTKARPFSWIDEPHDAPRPEDSILFRNGVLDFATGELRPHDGRYFATGLPAFDYDPDATCKRWDEFLDEVLDPSFHPTLHEFFGYAMTPDNSAEKLLALIGARRGGKSTVLRVLESLVGASHTLSRSLQHLGGDFGLEGLLDAKLLSIPDAHDATVSQRGNALATIKAVTGNDAVSVNRKGLKIITAKVPTRIVLTANRHPKFLDNSGALAAREIVIAFTTSFEGKEDRELFAKLHRELPGIANHGLAGLRRLRAAGMRFTIGAKGLAAARELADAQSPALRFAKSHLNVTGNPNDYASLEDVFESYEMWSTAESLGSHERRNRTDFKADLLAALMAQGVQHARRRWHDPAHPRSGKGEIRRGFFGFTLEPNCAA